MWRIFGGAALVVAGIAAFIEAHSHRPGVTYPGHSRAERAYEAAEGAPPIHVGLSTTAYDLLRIGAWALVIFGALLVIVGLISYARADRRTVA